MRIEQVQRGDIIKTGGGKGIEVRTVDEYACSTFGTHINKQFCWDRGSEVQVTRKDETMEFSAGIAEDSPFSDKALFEKLNNQRNSSERV